MWWLQRKDRRRRAEPNRIPTGAQRYAVSSADDALLALGTRASGLTDFEASERLSHHGPNALPRPERRPLYERVAENFLHFFAVLLWTSAALAWIAGMPTLSIAIVVVVLVNGVFSYWQEFQAERAMHALEALLPRRVLVLRDGVEREIDASEVVCGDVLVVAEGQLIPADARVLSQERLRVDLSSLTGESRPVPRTAASVAPSAQSSTLANVLFAGTNVASGRGTAVVFATAGDTEFGRIARLTHLQRERPSPLEHELGRVTRVVTILAVAMGLCFFAAGTLLGGLSLVTAFLFAIGIIVANVPEGLLPTLTLSLALGVRRMSKRHAVVKRLSAVEALGATTLILTDKTGTLTENAMTVRWIKIGERVYRVSGSGYARAGAVEPLPASEGDAESAIADVSLALRVAALCCDAHLNLSDDDASNVAATGDPTEVAVLIAASKLGLSAERLAQWPRLQELPFDSTRKRMTTVHRMDGERVACVKGAPMHVLERSAFVRDRGKDLVLEEFRGNAIRRAHDHFARRGYRVLGIAMRHLGGQASAVGEAGVDDVERDLVFLGLVAMEDPPRAAVRPAIRACRGAGVRVQMITGDDGLTARAIGREIDLYDEGARIVTGSDLDAINDDALVALLQRRDLLFARVTPEHKLRLVAAYQRRGEVVAVTGDGVNDAPALKRADVGVAMGETGTDVAREAADVVLADDDFSNIVRAIAEGRAVYDNVRKFVTYIFASNVPEIVPFAVFVLFRVPLPLTIMQILAVDLGTDLLPALALGAEPAEEDVMQRRPRRRDERLLDPSTLLRAYAWLGVIQASLCLGGYFFSLWWDGWSPGAALPGSGVTYARATTMSLAGIVSCQIGNVFACRSRTRSAFAASVTKNPLLILGVTVEILLLLALIHVPPLARAFGLAPLDAERWLLLACFAPTLLLLEELRKVFVRPKAAKSEPSDASRTPVLQG